MIFCAQYDDGEDPPEELEGALSCTLAAGCRFVRFGDEIMDNG